MEMEQGETRIEIYGPISVDLLCAVMKAINKDGFTQSVCEQGDFETGRTMTILFGERRK